MSFFPLCSQNQYLLWICLEPLSHEPESQVICEWQKAQKEKCSRICLWQTSLAFPISFYLKVTSLLLILSCHFCSSRRKDELKLVYNWWPSSFSLGRCWNIMGICSLPSEVMDTLLCMAASLAVSCCKILRSLCCLSTWHHIKHKEYQMTQGVTLNHSRTGPAGLKNFRAPLIFKQGHKDLAFWAGGTDTRSGSLKNRSQ